METACRDRLDLLILDLMLPIVDGLDVCRILRAESDLPILMLTALSTEADLLLGSDLGADDYVTKPFSPVQLVARVRALLRRAQVVQASAASTSNDEITLGPLILDPARHQVTLDGELVDCRTTEFELLALVIADPDQVFSHAQRLQTLHGSDLYPSPPAIDSHVKILRRKIEDDPRAPRLLLTVHGIGYKATSSR